MILYSVSRQAEDKVIDYSLYLSRVAACDS